MLDIQPSPCAIENHEILNKKILTTNYLLQKNTMLVTYSLQLLRMSYCFINKCVVLSINDIFRIDNIHMANKVLCHFDAQVVSNAKILRK